jgi:hypothetical protein
MISESENPVLIKSSAFSLASTATAMSVNNSMEKKKVFKNCISM